MLEIQPYGISLLFCSDLIWKGAPSLKFKKNINMNLLLCVVFVSRAFTSFFKLSCIFCLACNKTDF